MDDYWIQMLDKENYDKFFHWSKENYDKFFHWSND